MTSPSEVSSLVARLSAARAGRRRRVDPAVERRFQAHMHCDFLTPGGAPYKWQDLTATVSRAIQACGTPAVVPVRYTWQGVSAQVGTPANAGEPREWTFARGQGFSSVLLHTDAIPARPAAEPEAAAAAPDVSYPDLPKSPAVDLLLMLSWDVITFDMLCTQLTSTPALNETGRQAELERISGTWANLRFTTPGTEVAFCNNRATASKIGFGMLGRRPAFAYAYQCLDCRLTVCSGPITQEGRSSYWGILHVDADSGDLLAAEMTEMIVSSLTGTQGGQVPVQKRRMVRLRAAEESQAAPASAPGMAADGVMPGSVADGHGTGDGGADADTRALLDSALRHTGQVIAYLRWQLGSLDQLPGGIGPLAVMGFRSMVGADVPGALHRVRALEAGLRAWSEGDQAAAADIRGRLPADRQTLEGLLAFCQIAVTEASRLHIRDEATLAALHTEMTSVGQRLAELITLLDRLCP